MISWPARWLSPIATSRSGIRSGSRIVILVTQESGGNLLLGRQTGALDPQTHAERGAAFVAEALTLPGESTLAEALAEAAD